MKQVSGGVCAPKGFRAAGIHCGLRRNPTLNDISLIMSDVRASAAAVYTTNKVRGATIDVTKAHLGDGMAQAILCNSGYANTCTANGEEAAKRMCALLSEHACIPAEDVIVSSTGVIGKPMPIEPVEKGMAALVADLGYDKSTSAARGILTTDQAVKEIAVEFTLGQKICRIGAIAKGSGMIRPNMATMLVFAATDAAISPEMLQRALSEDVQETFNMVTVDGDTSTNDMAAVLANGMAGNAPITEEGEDYDVFCAALRAVTEPMCRAIARDGEGATKLLTCEVTGARDSAAAKKIAKAVVGSTLVKTAMFGMDANWGRVLCAIGYAGADVDPWTVDVSFRSANGHVDVCRAGVGISFSEEDAQAVLAADEVVIAIGLGSGTGRATAWGCDMTYEYVRISGNYRARK